MDIGTTNNISSLNETAISEILDNLHEESSIERHLPGGGYLHMSEPLPYLVIYRLPLTDSNEEEEDTSTVRFVLSEASFLIIGNKDFQGYQDLLKALGDAMASNFKTFLLFELYAGTSTCTQFRIKGPSEKLPATLKILKKELDALISNYKILPLQPTEIQNTEQRQPDGLLPLLGIDALKAAGCLLLSLEIPPVYKNKDGSIYPVFFRSFKDKLVVALHRAIYEFIRVQTTSDVSSYYALGQKSLQEKALEIDRELARIETSYQFLWLVSPSNIRSIKETFFKSNYEKVLNYHYRLLPIDPDLLKRELYSLRIEEIDDPALSFVFREKREELELQISMLKDRGTKHFFYNSLMLYHGIDPELHEEALALLEEVEEEDSHEPKELLDAQGFKELAEKEFDYFRGQDEDFSSKIHVRDDVNILMVSQGELYIPSDYRMDATSTMALIQHEVGTHVLTYYNGRQQPLKQLSSGLTDYDSLQEGIAVLSEYLVDGLTANRMRTLAGRVVAAWERLQGGNLQSIFNKLREDHAFSAARAFDISSRIMQGSGFIKDIIYLQGIVELKKYLEEGGDLETLLLGKFALKHLPIIKELRERKVLKASSILPRYLHTAESKERLKKIREGMNLSQMIRT